MVNKKIIEFDFGNINERLEKLGDKLNQLVIICHQRVVETLDMSWFNNEIDLICRIFDDVLQD